MENENNDTNSLYDGLSSIYDEEYVPSDDTIPSEETYQSDSILDPETEPEQETASESSDDTETDESVMDSTSETTETEVDSDGEFCSSCSAETVLDDSAGFYFVESSAEDSSIISDNDYLRGIYENTVYSTIFVFAILLLLVVGFFSRFLNNLLN